jgi:hypothetical protein
MVSISPFERTPLKKLFSEEKYQDVKEQLCNQFKMF